MMTCNQHERLMDSISQLYNLTRDSHTMLASLSAKMENVVSRRELDLETEKLRKSMAIQKWVIGGLMSVLTVIGGGIIFLTR